jgi:defect-in-organelle-trafficking protein DotB
MDTTDQINGIQGQDRNDFSPLQAQDIFSSEDGVGSIQNSGERGRAVQAGDTSRFAAFGDDFVGATEYSELTGVDGIDPALLGSFLPLEGDKLALLVSIITRQIQMAREKENLHAVERAPAPSALHASQRPHAFSAVAESAYARASAVPTEVPQSATHMTDRTQLNHSVSINTAARVQSELEEIFGESQPASDEFRRAVFADVEIAGGYNRYDETRSDETSTEVCADPSAVDTGPRFPDEPLSGWVAEDVQRLVTWGADLGCSDFDLRSSNVPWIKLDGRWQSCGRKILTTNELTGILDEISGDSSASMGLKSNAGDSNFAFEFERSRGERLRFRCNASTIMDGYTKGIRIILRTIPSEPPSIDSLALEASVLKYIFPENGLVLVSGKMGSGKSTLIAACMRRIIEAGGRQLITYEDPIEFNFDNVKLKNGPVSQSQIPDHFNSFLSAVQNSTRSAPDVILIGEAREPETFRGMMEAAELGVAVYSTVHTQSVPETIQRVINDFPHEAHAQLKTTLVSALRLIIHQRLVPKVGGGRIAVREWLPFTPNVRKHLTGFPAEDLPAECERLMIKFGRSLQASASELFMRGQIDEYQFTLINSERWEGVVKGTFTVREDRKDI